MAHGATYSTYDIYTNWLSALRQTPGVSSCKGFDYHTLIAYHDLASSELKKQVGIDFGCSSLDIIIKASRELLLDIIVENPDIVFFINGERLPPGIFVEIKKYRKETGRNFLLVGYLTEAPYINEELDRISSWYDVLFTNDLYDKERRNPDGKKFVYYLPHGYNPYVHYPMQVNDEYKKGVFFCGSLFPERVELMQDIEWSKIKDPLITGVSNLKETRDAYGTVLDQWKLDGLYEERVLANLEVANYYRGSNIVLNKHRTFGWTPGGESMHIDNNVAYSTGPRILEVAGCGGFSITDYRPEVKDIFGDSVPIFENSEQLNQMIDYYTSHADIRKNMSAIARKRASQHTYHHRAKFAVEVFSEALDVYRKTGGNRK